MANGSIDISGIGKTIGESRRRERRELNQEDPQIQALKLQKLLADTKLRVNEAMQIETENFVRGTEIAQTLRDAQRQEAQFKADMIKKGIELMRESPQAGALVLQESIPGLKFEKIRPGYFNAIVQNKDGSTSSFPIDLNRVTSPQERFRIVSGERAKFLQQSKNFETQSQFFRSLVASSKASTGASDTVILDSFAKIKDPRGRVTEADVAIALETVGFSEQIRNRIVKAYRGEGPLFGPKGAISRENFVRASRKLMVNALRDMVAFGENVVSFGNARGFDGRQMVAPVGGLDIDDFTPANQLTPDQRKAKEDRLFRFLTAIEDPLMDRVVQFEDAEDAARVIKKNAPPPRTKRSFFESVKKHITTKDPKDLDAKEPKSLTLEPNQLTEDIINEHTRF